MIRLPPGARGIVVREIRPAVLRLDVQRLGAREIPIRPRFTAASLARFLVRGAPEVTPATVRVIGPAEDLARIRFLETLPIELVSEDSVSFVSRATLDTADLARFAVSPGSVRVSGTVDVHGRRILAEVPVVSAGGVTGSVDLRLDGPARVLAALDQARVRAEETDADGLRIVGLPASVQAEVTARRAAVAAPALDSAGGPP
jgi:hypothetical protein